MKSRHLNFLQYYEERIHEGLLTSDPGQAKLAGALTVIESKLLSKRTLLSRVQGLFNNHRNDHSLYVHGSVGSGKSYLMDLFFSYLPIEKKCRLHFHHFMQDIHQQLTENQGQAEPLAFIANQLIQDFDLICLDEFMVKEIADAMILRKLLTLLFEGGVSMIFTSNIPPSDLYKGGLQRERFMPAVQAISDHAQIFELSSPNDYRLNSIKKTGNAFYDRDPHEGRAKMDELFETLAHTPISRDVNYTLLGRTVSLVALSPNIIWFDFNELCSIPRNKHDYLAIANDYEIVMCSGIRPLNSSEESLAINFIHLVDILYDCRVKFIFSTIIEIEALLVPEPLKVDFIRTLSRLNEMSSDEYLHQAHQVIEQ